MVGAEAAERIDRSVAELDQIMARLRSGIYESAVIDLTEPTQTHSAHHGNIAPRP